MLANIMAGAQNLLTLDAVLALVAGTVGGMVIGALPGFSAAMGVSLLIPITYGMNPVAALTMLVAMYTSAIYGGSITAILCHTPGTPASAATAIDGYQLTKKGRGMEAMGVATFGSALGGTVSAIAMLLIAPALGAFSLKFSVLEYFLLAVFGLTVIASLAGDSVIKGLFSGVMGLALGCVGLDAITGVPRMTLGVIQLEDGINFVPALIGLFSISQVMSLAWDVYHGKKGSVIEDQENLKKSRRLPPWKEMKTLFPTMGRCSIVGTIVGIVPAAGAGVSSWICYSLGKRFSKHPEEFGHGALEGVASCETGNNAATGGALIPLITLGLPGSSVAAILLGGMMIHGLTPGASMFTEHAPTTYAIMIGFLIANILMGVIGMFAAKYIARVSTVPMGLLGPVIVALATAGTFAIRNNMFDVYVMLAFGLIGFVLKKCGFAAPPMILGMVLSEICENNWRRAVILANAKGGMLQYFMGRPIAIVLAILIVISLFSPILMNYVNKKSRAIANEK
ncbi:Tripartite tricarboxylate transporter TctA family [uncultured Flavonifractor sp.]|uniref:tripartite tricarboxylate transporter permease n=1 Tax=Eubacteriales TaxID=186802 RepID=UPI0008214041|nr:tripartite tricarboxylate transporter permease [Lawsonibacter sp. OA9]MCH1980721.1 tripartite tricarboxylate transporter permease [Lawsonibacter sp. OA9]SCI73351.1 Tripartite tricarboxylate transporter TctA family [uncultured Flavonifractor sp.]